MTKITWLGGEECGNAAFNQWGKYRFVINTPLEVNDPHIIAKASTNRFYKVEGGRVSRPITSAEIKANGLSAAQVLEMTGDLDEWSPSGCVQNEEVPDDPANDPDPPPEPQPPVRALEVPDIGRMSDEELSAMIRADGGKVVPVAAPRRGRPPKAKAA